MYRRIVLEGIMKQSLKRVIASALAVLLVLFPLGSNVAHAQAPIEINFGSVTLLEGGEFAEVDVTI